MIENIRSSGPRLDQPLQDDTQQIGKTGRPTASGIANLQSTVPPSTVSASPSVASTFAPASKVAAAEYDRAVAGAADRFSAAASTLNPAIIPDSSTGLALSPLDAARALFKAALQSNDHQQDDALQKRKEAMEAARSQQLAQAALNKADAKNIDSNSWKQLITSTAAACSTAWSANFDYKSKPDKALEGLTKGLDGLSGKFAASTQADTKNHDADGQIAASNAELANTHKADANDMAERLRQQFQQLFQALSEMRAEKANQLRALV